MRSSPKGEGTNEEAGVQPIGQQPAEAKF